MVIRLTLTPACSTISHNEFNTDEDMGMRIVVTGARGQLGQALVATLQGQHEVTALGHQDIELQHPDTVDTIAALRPALIIHAAAMTHVDGCARDPQLAYSVNGLGTRWVALAARRANARMIAISTNEVFDGTGDRPYWEYDRPNPINAYAQSKYAGELAAREVLERLYIVRVAWLFGGARNFVRTVLRLAAEQPQLRMVHDEVGSPTHASDVACAVAQLMHTDMYGTYHLVNEGSCSRLELARYALACAGRADYPIEPMPLADFVRPSRVPAYTPLANMAGAALGITLRPWQDAVAEFVTTQES
jgi:dTDP-4-dehydrorhamnose reductase